jgi:hypothetical protein
MAKKSTDITVFYAWQSDKQTVFNRNLIKHALRVASNAVEARSGIQGLKIDLQEATCDEPGSPNIPALILSKIDAADIFVCDITTINTAAPPDYRRVPNPNVTFELGYAVSQLGWDRVIMLFNTALGNLKQDPPFDFDRQRISQFNVDVTAAKTKAGKAGLEALLTTALESVIVKNPPRPAERKALTAKQIQRTRDIENLRRIMGAIHWPTLDQHLLEAPRIVRHQIFYFWEEFTAIFRCSLFHLYDARLRRKLSALHDYWETTVSFGQHYRPTLNGDSVFSNPLDMPLSAVQQSDWDTIATAARQLKSAKESLLKYLRKRYLEIDIDGLSQSAWKKHVQ